jgi:SNF2 family DNA or RNA helicase
MEFGIDRLRENIHQHIGFHTPVEVSWRGRQLYEKKNVILEEHYTEKDIWKFLVFGSRQYQVIIKGVISCEIHHSCTCPYDWGTVCKHVVAALLFVADNLQEPFSQKESPEAPQPKFRTGKELGLEVRDYQNISMEFIRKNVSSILFGQLFYLRSFSNCFLEISKTEIKFIPDNQNDWVKFYKSGENVFITANSITKYQKLTTLEAQCLYSIATSPVPNFLDEVFSGRIFTKQTELMNSYGLPGKDSFYKYFYFAFTNKEGLVYKTTDIGKGLVPITEYGGHAIAGLLEKINISVPELIEFKKKKEERELGFVIKQRISYSYNFSHSNYNSNYNDTGVWFNIVPIVGKTQQKNPTRLATAIKEYKKEMEDKYIIEKSENTARLLHLIEKIDGNSKSFNLNRQAFDCLLQEKFVYGQRSNSYNIRKMDLTDVDLSPEPVDVVFEVDSDHEFITLNLKMRIGELLQKRKHRSQKAEEHFFHEIGNVIHFVKNEMTAQLFAQFPETLKMVAGYKDEFYNNVVQPLSKNYEIRFNNGTFTTEKVELDFNEKQLFLSERDEYVVFTPCVEYDNNVTADLSAMGNILVKNVDVITEYKRNFELEDEFLDSLSALHPDFENQKSKKMFHLHYTEFTKDLWFYKFFDQLQSSNVEVYGLKDLKYFRYSPYKGQISTTVASGQDWFEVDVAVRFGDNRVSLNDIKKAILNKQRYIQLKDGSVGILPSEWYHKLEKYFRNGEIKNDKLEISKLRFSVIDELFDNLDDVVVLQEIAEKKLRLKSFTDFNVTKVPKQIKAQLRHYQKEGLNWLNFLDEMKWGGILADDMGLGKTLQVLTFLQQQANQKQATNLIVMPTTLLFNWQNELVKFAPKLKAFFYYGGDRKKSTSDFEKYDLVLTTYGILVRDIEVLRQFSFNYAVLDESQAIKNPGSHRYKAACLIIARNKIALTGTPIENSTFDLFAQMNFANRGFFGGMQKFREDYAMPIDKEGNELISGELNKIINPFVLRRTKEKVAPELPDKTEDILYCEMETAQRRVYDAYLNEYRNKLLNKIEEEGIEKSKLMVLEALTRLRQICDSPVLLNSDDVSETQSIKIKELVRHITNKTGKHKILIFSQFVKMLGLIRDELAKLNIGFEYLDGQSSSRQREHSVNNFQENENLRVFLISLKAGGTGLNLTAADYVYVVDPWWNPAVENQAIDRCHRIGQEKKVFAYRMICKNTVEEKILALQDKKKKVAGEIIRSDDSILKKLNLNDIKELFS